MTVINPPGFLQNAGATHTAELTRNAFGALVAGVTSSTGLVPRGGVVAAHGNGLVVTQSGSPAMSVVVKSGAAVISGTEGAKQGTYSVLNDADVTLTIAAAHATLNRIDIVVFKVEDTAYSGAANQSSLAVVTGTPAGSPVAPAAPNNSTILAQVSIVANDTSITNGEITDRRSYVSAAGGTIVCTSTTRPAAGTVFDGQLLYETDTDLCQITHDAGTTWLPVNLGPWKTWSPGLTNLTQGSGTVSARFTQQAKTVTFRFVFTFGAGSAVGTLPAFTLPLAPHAQYANGDGFATASLVDNGGNTYPAAVLYDGSSICGFRIIGAAGTYAVHDANVAATVPFIWGSGDKMMAWGTYEAA